MTDLPAEAQAEEGANRLDVILRALPEKELMALVKRMGIRVDDQKRIDTPSQVARSLTGMPDVRDPSRLPPASQELLHRVAEAGGTLLVKSLPAGVDALVARGILFGRRAGTLIELVLPPAYIVQLPTWEGEDPRSLRALLAQAPFESVSAIASHFLGRPATPPLALSLEAAWETLSDPARLRDVIDKIAPPERRLLEAVEGMGGEVDTQELLDLEREPMRLRGAMGITASRRGLGFALERRALLVPVHPNRHVVPTEVSRIVGEARRRAAESRRQAIRAHVIAEDHAPRRASFARDPWPLAIALAMAQRESASEVKAGVGTPKSLLGKLASRIGTDPETTGLLSALSRAIGLWDAPALSTASPPGAWPVREITRALFAAWRRGGAWDEARPEREVLRAPPDQRDASPATVLREVVLDALSDLGEGSWLPWSALAGYLASDPRTEGLDRLFRRWSERVHIAEPSSGDVARRIALETLPTLGVVDVSGSIAEAGEDPCLRLTARGRALLAGKTPSTAPTAAEFVDAHVLRVGTDTTTSHVLSLAGIIEIGRTDSGLDLVLSPAVIAKAISAGVDGEALRERIEVIARMPESLSQTMMRACAVVGRGTFAMTAGFLWIEDVDIRELLRTRRGTADLFLDPSPPGGLLVAADVDMDRLVRRCRALGVEIESDGQALRAEPGTSGVVRQVGGPRRKSTARGMPVRRETPAGGIPRSETPVPKRQS
jgi:hypothetical protein